MLPMVGRYLNVGVLSLQQLRDRPDDGGGVRGELLGRHLDVADADFPARRKVIAWRGRASAVCVCVCSCMLGCGCVLQCGRLCVIVCGCVEVVCVCVNEVARRHARAKSSGSRQGQRCHSAHTADIPNVGGGAHQRGAAVRGVELLHRDGERRPVHRVEGKRVRMSNGHREDW